MNQAEIQEQLAIIRKKKAAIDKRQERIAKEIELLEAIRDKKGVKRIQALMDYFRK